jgi:hypothetical protein
MEAPLRELENSNCIPATLPDGFDARLSALCHRPSRISSVPDRLAANKHRMIHCRISVLHAVLRCWRDMTFLTPKRR